MSDGGCTRCDHGFEKERPHSHIQHPLYRDDGDTPHTGSLLRKCSPKWRILRKLAGFLFYESSASAAAIAASAIARLARISSRLFAHFFCCALSCMPPFGFFDGLDASRLASPKILVRPVFIGGGTTSPLDLRFEDERVMRGPASSSAIVRARRPVHLCRERFFVLKVAFW